MPSLARLFARRYRRTTDTLEFRVLGPLQIAAGGKLLPLGGAKQRGVLALLLLHANEVVSTDRLIDALWGESPPESAANMVQGYVSQLRKTLEPGRARGEHALLASRPPGYVLHVESDQLDAAQFERLASEGRRLLDEGDPDSASRRLSAALALWRGPALADLAYESFARPYTERLDELRLRALEDRIEADLAGGRHADVAELGALVSTHPLRERLRAQLMTALYRSGQQAEALEVYREGRGALHELGLEPGPSLRALEQAILRQDAELGAAAPARRVAPTTRRRRALAAAALAAAGGAVTALVLVTQGGTQGARVLVHPGADVLLAATNGHIVREATAPNAVRVRFGLGSLWSVSADGVLTRVDPATGRTIATLGLGVTPSGLAVGGGSVWVTDANSRTLLRIDPALDVVADRITLPPAGTEETQDVAFAAGSVWVAHGGFNPGAWVDRLDPRTGRVVHRVSILAGEATALAVGDGALWVASAPAGELRKIDPRRNEIAERVRLREGTCCVAVGGGYVWVAVNPDGSIWKLGEDGTILTTLKLPARIASIAYGDGALWATDGEGGAVIRIDPTTNARRVYRLGHRLTGIDVQGGLVAVGVEQSAQDVTAALKGRIVRIAVKADTLFWSGAPTDPALWATWDAHQLDFHHATCATLLGYRDVEGEGGKRLVPEAAAAWPKVTDGGRTYTFTIRRGYRFSPPSNEPVAAQSFLHTIERVLSPKFPWFESTAADIVGAAAFHAGRVRNLPGVTADGDRLVIRLIRPAPDLPRRLALSPYCVVPASTPVVAHGVDAPIPSAGPYYLAAHTDSVAVLKRNPGYRGPRPRHLDAIVYEFGIAPGVAAARIAKGTLDYVLEYDPALGPDTPAARAARTRYRLTPDATASTRFLAFNTRRPLFADIRRRRAVQYVLDRRALATIDAALPATRLLSPRLPNFDAAPRYPLRPDLRRARRLLGAGRFHAVVAALDPASEPRNAAFVRALRNELAAVGISITVLPLTNSDFENGTVAAKAARADLVWGGGNVDEGDAVSYLQGLDLRGAHRAELDRIARFSGAKRDAAAAAFARKLDDESLFAVYENGAIPELVSPRLGCVVHQPEYAGVDLAALCLKRSGTP